ncbi:MAG: ABC transporter ATP-binding protein [Pseudomonadota bacterium]
MISRLLGWVERRIDIFAPFDHSRTPPANVWGFIWFYVHPFRRLLAGMFVLIVLLGIIESSMLLLVGKFIDMLSQTSPSGLVKEHGLALVAITVLILLIRPALIIVSEGLLNQTFFVPIAARVRWRAHSYTLGHALSYFQNDYAGRIANRVMQVGPGVQQITIEIMDTMTYVIVYASVALIAFTTISPYLMAPVLVWIGAYITLLLVFVPRAVKLSYIQSETRSALVGRVVDSYTNVQTVKLFARTEHERSNVRGAIADHTRKVMATMRLLTVAVSTLVIMNALLLFFTGLSSVLLWQNDLMTVGEIASGLALVLRLADMSRWVMQIVRNIFENLGTVQESMDTISRAHTLVDKTDAKPLVVSEGGIAFDHVGFHYGKGSGIIDDLNFDIRPGEKVGLIGPSGAGKSTIVSLLLRLYDIESGRILIDGQDISSVTQDSLRSAIGVVTQDNSLLHRSIGANIAYGRYDASEEAIIAAARQAEAHDFIAQLNDRDGRIGYESRVGERGVKLSGGQRQRISIARVLLKDAPILVLDEATSALDSTVEVAIQEQLDKLMKGKTVIAIAHRLSTIAAMDRLIVMDNGRIVEQGKHNELVEKNGLYASLWSHQSGGFLAEKVAA